ncbi:unnamed protein product [Heligmosomoides polygyrus]|uniref:DH domain-containing protein n=1 Tax=Heligmosomoides polygyrus TaxID=6339 RepID=A0A183GUK6_HELPZ|nr:unnamed protein product [Heligmosomoides polygyrus]
MFYVPVRLGYASFQQSIHRLEVIDIFQTEHQYLYIHQVLLLYLKQQKYLDDSVTPYLEAFSKDYYKATKGF